MTDEEIRIAALEAAAMVYQGRAAYATRPRVIALARTFETYIRTGR
jgi:hypothetical protein